ncbi:MAG: heterodisulfide reductase-related iron-sulfur binding cluster [Acidobacteria bacterium]|jgi:Fe-S oxidoreductase|nr:heterodisulfide reductase-related iron-sulfur binding cluster [Acidobacteriota bacterium]
MLSLIEKILFVAAVLLASGLALAEFMRKLRLVNSGRKTDRCDRLGRRLGRMAFTVFFQIPVIAQRPVSGLFHGFIFWGFLVFLGVTLNHVAEGFQEGFSLFGHGMLYAILLGAANLFAGLIILAVIYFFARRYIVRVRSLERPSYQSLTVLGFILILMVSFIYYEAFKMTLAAAPVYKANFLANWAFAALPAALVSAPQLAWVKFLWWLHILVIMAFGVFILYSKHLHLLAGPLNLVFQNLGVKAEVPLVNLEEQEKFGTPQIIDLTRKDLLDLFSCAECGRCDDVCPAFQSGKALSPKLLLDKLKHHLLDSASTLRGDPASLKKLLGEVVSEEEVWDCTTCAACMEVCPMLNEHIAKIMGMRQFGVMMESRFPEELQTLFRGLENQGNPWGINADSRGDWAKDLQVPLLAEKGKTDILFWVGCAGSYDQHAQKISRSLVKIMQRAGCDFAILGNEEKCCGDPARRSGMEYLFQMQARENIETLRRYPFQRIVTACPHGLHVLKNEYPKMGGHYRVLHHSELLDELLAQGKVRVASAQTGVVTYHDPCYLGRYNQIYDPPRRVLQRLKGGPLREMAASKKTSYCCGAGGGGMWKEEKSGKRISHCRLEQAEKTGAGAVITSCPFCSVMFHDAIAETGRERLQTLDLAQVVEEMLV